ncbi:MAG: Fe(2+) transporter permease subunit FeoB [Candidatus Cloacimonetes bacterium]|nr:Fe(2+) transporter permease subunit FeoB [Candidatus Cloacimonadota bacterium]MBL7148702.1 Fe(2+) transporter permease subunit FeoB [Candidatus Cloacimonadota bacterium]
MKKITIALAGNPNCGKTTLFNALTGSKQRVGNWPGVTVERIEGEYKHKDYKIEVIDLPGIYSFSAYSLDEKIAREYILMDKPDLVVNIVDGTNLERNLYLTTQLLEMKIPVVVALNMMDIAKQRKIHIEVEHLETHLGCPVIPMVASKKQGLEELKDTINIAAEKHEISKTRVLYDSVVEDTILKILYETAPFAKKHEVDSRWLAIKLLESDELAIQLTNNELNELVSIESARIEKHVGDEIDIIIADGRYGFIHGLSRDVVHRHDQVRKTVSDNIDKVVLNRFLGIPIFFGVMYLMFMLTINVGAPFIDFFDIFMGTIFVDGLGNLLTSFNLPSWLITFLSAGIGGGIQTVATFIPPIFFMFLSLSILEDSGYMSRAAFVMDRFMRFIGLPGKAFIPMLVGFGCNVPAIMATRTLENNRDRILTILINPFMSCGARLPVYILFASIFFPRSGGLIVFTIYSTGIILAIISGLIFKKTILKGETSTFVMELPPYHIPTFNGIMLHTWQRLKTFLLRAGKVIIIVVIVLSFLNSIGTDGSFGNEDSENSILSSIGKSITPIFKPMGISSNNWPATVGLFTGIFAKEAVVGTLDALYSQLDETEETEEKFDFWGGIVESFKAIPEGFKGFEETAADPMGLSVETSDQEIVEEELEVDAQIFSEMSSRFGGKNNAFAYLLFILIYVPCVAAIAVIYRETNLKWAIFSSLYLTFLAWLISTLFYQVSIFIVQPAVSTMWIAIIIAIFIIFYYGMKSVSKRKMVSS